MSGLPAAGAQRSHDSDTDGTFNRPQAAAAVHAVSGIIPRSGSDLSLRKESWHKESARNSADSAAGIRAFGQPPPLPVPPAWELDRSRLKKVGLPSNDPMCSPRATGARVAVPQSFTEGSLNGAPKVMKIKSLREWNGIAQEHTRSVPKFKTPIVADASGCKNLDTTLVAFVPPLRHSVPGANDHHGCRLAPRDGAADESQIGHTQDELDRIVAGTGSSLAKPNANVKGRNAVCVTPGLPEVATIPSTAESVQEGSKGDKAHGLEEVLPDAVASSPQTDTAERGSLPGEATGSATASVRFSAALPPTDTLHARAQGDEALDAVPIVPHVTSTPLPAKAVDAGACTEVFSPSSIMQIAIRSNIDLGSNAACVAPGSPEDATKPFTAESAQGGSRGDDAHGLEGVSLDAGASLLPTEYAERSALPGEATGVATAAVRVSAALPQTEILHRRGQGDEALDATPIVPHVTSTPLPAKAVDVGACAEGISSSPSSTMQTAIPGESCSGSDAASVAPSSPEVATTLSTAECAQGGSQSDDARGFEGRSPNAGASLPQTDNAKRGALPGEAFGLSSASVCVSAELPQTESLHGRAQADEALDATPIAPQVTSTPLPAKAVDAGACAEASSPSSDLQTAIRGEAALVSPRTAPSVSAAPLSALVSGGHAQVDHDLRILSAQPEADAVVPKASVEVIHPESTVVLPRQHFDDHAQGGSFFGGDTVSAVNPGTTQFVLDNRWKRADPKSGVAPAPPEFSATASFLRSVDKHSHDDDDNAGLSPGFPPRGPVDPLPAQLDDPLAVSAISPRAPAPSAASEPASEPAPPQRQLPSMLQACSPQEEGEGPRYLWLQASDDEIAKHVAHLLEDMDILTRESTELFWVFAEDSADGAVQEPRVAIEKLHDVTQRLIDLLGTRDPAILQRLASVYATITEGHQTVGSCGQLEFTGYVAAVLTQVLRELESSASKDAPSLGADGGPAAPCPDSLAALAEEPPPAPAAAEVQSDAWPQSKRLPSMLEACAAQAEGQGPRQGLWTQASDTQIAEHITNLLKHFDVLTRECDDLFSVFAQEDGSSSEASRIPVEGLHGVTQRLIDLMGSRDPGVLQRLGTVYGAMTGGDHSDEGLGMVEFRGYVAAILTQVLRELESRQAEETTPDGGEAFPLGPEDEGQEEEEEDEDEDWTSNDVGGLGGLLSMAFGR